MHAWLLACRVTPTATVKGRLAEKPPLPGQALRGVLVRQEAGDVLLHPDDLPTYTKLSTGAGAGTHLACCCQLVLLFAAAWHRRLCNSFWSLYDHISISMYCNVASGPLLLWLSRLSLHP